MTPIGPEYYRRHCSKSVSSSIFKFFFNYRARLRKQVLLCPRVEYHVLRPQHLFRERHLRFYSGDSVPAVVAFCLQALKLAVSAGVDGHNSACKFLQLRLKQKRRFKDNELPAPRAFFNLFLYMPDYLGMRYSIVFVI